MFELIFLRRLMSFGSVIQGAPREGNCISTYVFKLNLRNVIPISDVLINEEKIEETEEFICLGRLIPSVRESTEGLE